MYIYFLKLNEIEQLEKLQKDLKKIRSALYLLKILKITAAENAAAFKQIGYTLSVISKSPIKKLSQTYIYLNSITPQTEYNKPQLWFKLICGCSVKISEKIKILLLEQHIPFQCIRYRLK